MPIQINKHLSIGEEEISLSAICSGGSGGQNVNKVSTAIHLRFDINASSLPDPIKTRLLNSGDQRISKDGVLVIKAHSHRTQERNRTEALARLRDTILKAGQKPKPRIATKPSRAQKKKRLDDKKRRSMTKQLRGKPS